MALKRKRSATHLSSPTTSNTSGSDTSSSPLPSFFSHAKPTPMLYEKPSWSFPTCAEDLPSHLGSRTRKRHRDNRPDEHMIHGKSTTRQDERQPLTSKFCRKHNKQALPSAKTATRRRTRAAECNDNRKHSTAKEHITQLLEDTTTSATGHRHDGGIQIWTRKVRGLRRPGTFGGFDGFRRRSLPCMSAERVRLLRRCCWR